MSLMSSPSRLQTPATPPRLRLIPALWDAVRQRNLSLLSGGIGLRRSQVNIARNLLAQADATLNGIQQQVLAQIDSTTTLPAEADGTAVPGGTTTVPIPTTPQPVVTTTAPTAVTSNGATLQGTVNAQNQQANWWFTYYAGDNPSDVMTTPVQTIAAGAGATAQSVSAAITNLASGVNYYFQLVASYPSGTSVSTTPLGFSTAAAPTGAPVPQTGQATQLTPTSATLNGTVVPASSGTTTYAFNLGQVVGTTVQWQATPVGSGTVTGTGAQAVSANAVNLVPGSTYHFQLTATDGGATVNGEDQWFTTPSVPPIVTPAQPTSITANSAILQGTVNPQNQQTNWWFKYYPGDNPADVGVTPTISIPQGLGSTPQSVSAPVTNLAPGVTYYFQLVAAPPSGPQVTSGTLSFPTLSTPTGGPSAQTNPATSVSATSAVLNGTVTPATAGTTSYFFNLSPTGQYGPIPVGSGTVSGTGPHAVSVTVPNLQPNTTYHFQVGATINGTTIYGEDQTFTTLASGSPPPSPSPGGGTSVQGPPEELRRKLYEIYETVPEDQMTKHGYPKVRFVRDQLEELDEDFDLSTLSTDTVRAVYDDFVHLGIAEDKFVLRRRHPDEDDEESDTAEDIAGLTEGEPPSRDVMFEIFEQLPPEAFSTTGRRYPLVEPVRVRTPRHVRSPTRVEIHEFYDEWTQQS